MPEYPLSNQQDSPNSSDYEQAGDTRITQPEECQVKFFAKSSHESGKTVPKAICSRYPDWQVWNEQMSNGSKEINQLQLQQILRRMNQKSTKKSTQKHSSSNSEQSK